MRTRNPHTRVLCATLRLQVAVARAARALLHCRCGLEACPKHGVMPQVGPQHGAAPGASAGRHDGGAACGAWRHEGAPLSLAAPRQGEPTAVRPLKPGQRCYPSRIRAACGPSPPATPPLYSMHTMQTPLLRTT